MYVVVLLHKDIPHLYVCISLTEEVHIDTYPHSNELPRASSGQVYNERTDDSTRGTAKISTNPTHELSS